MSEHQALYRKYRPEKFDDVVGQDHVVSVLQQQLKKQQTGHAYLFYGTRGLGKTTIARIFADEMGCQPEDLYEIDGASNRKIEHVRQLREQVRTLPMNSPVKVYIIDEVHMLTKEAFNALLKTLEEPPQHVVFMLATTEIEKLPDTIVSRCQVFTLRQPTQTILRDHLADVAGREGYTLAPESADLVALLGNGSFRDALGVLEKVVTYSKDKKIDADEVSAIVGAPTNALVHDMIASIASGDAPKGLQAIRTAAQQNVDMGLYLRMILARLRMLLLARFDAQYYENLKDQIADADYDFITTWRGKEGAVINARVLARFLQAVPQLAYSPVSGLPIELALLDVVDSGQ